MPVTHHNRIVANGDIAPRLKSIDQEDAKRKMLAIEKSIEHLQSERDRLIRALALQAEVATLSRKYYAAQYKVPRQVAPIAEMVAQEFGIAVDYMFLRSREPQVVFPRQVLMWILRQVTQDTLEAIGKYVGGYDHGTVLHACRAVRSRIETDSLMAVRLKALLAKAKQPLEEPHFSKAVQQTLTQKRKDT